MDYPPEEYPPAVDEQFAVAEPASCWQPLPENGRWLALLMQVKDSAQIVTMLLDGTLIFGVLFGIGLPGLVLYALRWRQLRRPVGRGATLVQGILSLGHEIFWARVFQDDTGPDPITSHSGVLAGLYWLGAALMGLQVLLVAGRWLVAAPAAEPAEAAATEEEIQPEKQTFA